MKIKLKDLLPNPFKKQINGGKLNQEKIEKLKESIKSDGFWDNIICRDTPEGYEIAYGHHRIEAAKQLFGGEHVVDIPCKKLTDEMMVRILANENNMQNEDYALYQVDTVKMAKTFLLELERPTCGQSKHGGDRRSQEIGARQISEFLGERNWCKSKVAMLLGLDKKLDPSILAEAKNSPNINQHSRKEFTVSHAERLARIPDHKKQREVFDVVKKYGMDTRATEELVAQVCNRSIPKKDVRRVDEEKVKSAFRDLEAMEFILSVKSMAEWMEKNSISDFTEKEEAILKASITKFDTAKQTFLRRRVTCVN